MKKIVYMLFILLGLLFSVGCGGEEKNLEKELLENFLSIYEVSFNEEKIDLPSTIIFNEKTIILEWELSEEVLDDEGNILYTEEELVASVTLKASLGNETLTKVVGEIKSKSLKELEKVENEKVIDEFLLNYNVSQVDDFKIILPESTKYNGKDILLEWVLDKEILNSDGTIIHGDKTVEANLTVKATLGDVTKEKVVGKVISISIEEMNNVEEAKKELVKKFIESFELKINGDERVELPEFVEFEGKRLSLTWEYDKTILKSDGTIKHGTETKTCELKVTVEIAEYRETFVAGEIVSRSAKELVDEAVKNVIVPNEINDSITLPKMYNGVEIEWYSENEKVLDETGKCYYVESATDVVLTALFICDASDAEMEYIIKVLPYTNEKRLQLALDEIIIEGTVSGNIELKDNYSYGTNAIWTSSREDVISNKGIVKLQSECIDIVLKVKIYIGEDYMEKSFTVKTAILNKLDLHYLVDRAKNFNKDNMVNVSLEEDRMVLNEGEIYGYYDSDIYETLAFDELVGSWAALSSTEATCELLVKVQVNGEWSKYFTYGIWGLGRNNLYYNQDDTNVKMSVDEILVKNGTANAFQYRIILRRNNAEVESPKVSLVSMALNIPNYQYEVDVTGLPTFIDYDVPKLNQNIVPEIGNSICSATTSTMLLKYKGFDFSDKDEFEHRYIANLVADRGHNSPTYGNWVYNTVTMGAYGLDSYVKRLYSWEELKWHLANVGPVGASIKGNAVLYTTGGHLIVARGYREVDGKTYVICNDPNINEKFGNDANGNPYFVYYEFPLDVFMNFWRGVIYVVE